MANLTLKSNTTIQLQQSINQDKRRSLSLGGFMFKREAEKAANLQKKLLKKTIKIWIKKTLPTQIRFKSLFTAFEDGAFIQLIQKLSGKTLKKYNINPKSKQEKYENIRITILFAKRIGIPITISPKDVVAKKLINVLEMMWQLIMFFRLEDIPDGEYEPNDILLLWSEVVTSKYNIKITDFSNSFFDGRAFCAIIDSAKPGTLPSKVFESMDKKERFVRAFEAGELYSIPSVLDVSDILQNGIEEISCMVYLAEAYHKLINKNDLEQLNEKIEPFSKFLKQNVSRFSRVTALPNSNQTTINTSVYLNPSKKVNRKFTAISEQAHAEFREKIEPLYHQLKQAQLEHDKLKKEYSFLVHKQENKEKTRDSSKKDSHAQNIEYLQDLIDENGALKVQFENVLKSLEDQTNENQQKMQTFLEVKHLKASRLENIRMEFHELSGNIQAKYKEEQNELEEENKILQSTIQNIEKELNSNPNTENVEKKDIVSRLRLKNEHIVYKTKKMESKITPLLEKSQKLEKEKQEILALKLKEEQKSRDEKAKIQELFLALNKEEKEVTEKSKTYDEEIEQLEMELKKSTQEFDTLTKYVQDEDHFADNANYYIDTLQKESTQIQSRLSQIEKFQKMEQKRQEQFELINTQIQNSEQKINEIKENIRKESGNNTFSIEELKKKYEELRKDKENEAEKQEKEIQKKSTKISELSTFIFQKNENLRDIQEKLQKVATKLSAQDTLQNEILQQKKEEIEREQMRIQNMQKINAIIEMDIKDLRTKFNEDLKQEIALVEEVEAQHHKKKTKKSKEMRIVHEDLSTFRKKYEEQKISIDKMHKDYDSVSKTLNSHIEIMESLKRSISSEEQKIKQIDNIFSQISEKYSQLQQEFSVRKKEHQMQQILFTDQETQDLNRKLKTQQEKMDHLASEIERFQFLENLQKQYLDPVILGNTQKSPQKNQNQNQNQNENQISKKLLNHQKSFQTLKFRKTSLSSSKSEVLQKKLTRSHSLMKSEDDYNDSSNQNFSFLIRGETIFIEDINDVLEKLTSLAQEKQEILQKIESENRDLRKCQVFWEMNLNQIREMNEKIKHFEDDSKLLNFQIDKFESQIY